MTTITHSYNQQGVADEEDKFTRQFLIDEENAIRTAFNSTTPPPVIPLPLLPFATAGERKTSVELIMSTKKLPAAWASYAQQAKESEAAKVEADKISVRAVRDKAVLANQAQRAAMLAAGPP